MVTRSGGLNPISVYFYEPIVSKFISQSSGNLFVDIGANVGSYSLIAAKNYKNVLAVEPGIIARQFLQKNKSLNCVENLMVDSHSIGLVESRTKFFHNGELINWTTVSQETNSQFDYVEMTTLDALLKSFEKVDLIKIDVEGAELDVVKSGRSSLNKIAEILIEVRDRYASDILRIMESYGFRSFVLEDRPRIGERNLLFSRRIYEYPEFNKTNLER
jgi:FkbM family methyltransferase